MFLSTYKKINLIVLLTALLSTYASCSSNNSQTPQHLTLHLPVKGKSDSPSKFGIRAKIVSSAPQSEYHRTKHTTCASITSKHFEQAFHDPIIEKEILNSYEFYASQDFCTYARTLPNYQDFILDLQDNIEHDKKFKKRTANIPGFKHSFLFFWETSGFHDFVRNEAESIRKTRKIQEEQAARELRQQRAHRLDVQNPQALKLLIKAWNEQADAAYHSGDSEREEIVAARIQALKQARDQQSICFDYSSDFEDISFTDPCADVFAHCYGTALDKQLHAELCNTRIMMMDLHYDYPEVMQIKTIYPVVCHFTAIAKAQTDPNIAFNLSDFCYHLTKVAEGFGNAAQIFLAGAGKGAINTAKDNIAFCTSLVTHPIDDIAKPLCHAGIALGKAVFHAAELAIHDPQKLGSHAKKLVARISHYVQTNPEEAIAEVVELLLSFKVPNLIKLKNVQSVVKAFQEQELFAQALQRTSSIATQITTPLKEVVADARALVNVGLQHGKSALQNLIKAVEQQTAIVSVGDIVALKIPPESFNDANKLSQTVKTLRNESFISNMTHKIRNLGDDILDIMENAGGHTLERHVSKTYNELILRLAKHSRVEMVSTFTNKNTAIRTVKENLKKNIREIIEWLRNSDSAPKAFDCLHKNPLGYGIPKGKTSPINDLLFSRVILEKDTTQDLGFKILTAFPIIK